MVPRRRAGNRIETNSAVTRGARGRDGRPTVSIHELLGVASSITETPETRNSPARWRADLALAGVALVWGATFVVVKSALTEISAVFFLALRFGIAALCMAVLFARPLRRAGLPAVLRGLRGGAAAGIFLWTGYMLQTFGLKYTSAG